MYEQQNENNEKMMTTTHTHIYIVHIIIYTYLEEKHNPPFGIDL